ncbi:NAD(P)-dependent alcohol dehydrogenase [Thermoactinospora rubra]|uniref:NAD(P)-dependent alcohol dehydrogenase n=1 Tax=Thermoactinospora rubra TaxID=1088767 RepID=UPI000A10B492|nr:NAD(P)-dependent alcohol dehydrogenase [Thermoactinospora rubra]
MKAWTWDRYGPPDVMELRDLAAPEPGDGEVLVRVRAASVNPYDWRHLRSDPQIVRLYAGFRRPKPGSILGADLAGVVERVGPGVSAFRPGDEVFGETKLGAFAELACVPAERLAAKPGTLSFEEAAAVPMAGQTALKALAGLRTGQRVLINGAAGGIGTFAVQIANAYGAEVTAVCSGRNAQLVRSLGADHVVDYTREDFTRSGRRHDLLVDLIGNHSLREMRRVVVPGGTLALVGGMDAGGRLLGPIPQIVLGGLLSRFVSQRIVGVSWTPTGEALRRLAALIEAGRVRPVLDRTYKFAEAPQALRYVESRHARGKVVIGGIA